LTDLRRDPARLQIGPYALRRRTRKGTAHAITWTWAISRTALEALRRWTILAARQPGGTAAGQLFDTLYATAGFSGVRCQVGRVIALFRREWRRRRRPSAAAPRRRQLRYCQRLPNEYVPIVWRGPTPRRERGHVRAVP
jgi:hypothetical protein